MEKITQNIKALLEMSGKNQMDLAAYLNISYQALRNKMTRGSFSADDLIKIAAFCNADLAFIYGDTSIPLDASCLHKISNL